MYLYIYLSVCVVMRECAARIVLCVVTKSAFPKNTFGLKPIYIHSSSSFSFSLVFFSLSRLSSSVVHRRKNARSAREANTHRITHISQEKIMKQINEKK